MIATLRGAEDRRTVRRQTTFLVAARATLAAIGVLAANRGALGRYGVARASPAV